jgi:hypothetical protein
MNLFKRQIHRGLGIDDNINETLRFQIDNSYITFNKNTFRHHIQIVNFETGEIRQKDYFIEIYPEYVSEINLYFEKFGIKYKPVFDWEETYLFIDTKYFVKPIFDKYIEMKKKKLT